MKTKLFFLMILIILSLLIVGCGDAQLKSQLGNDKYKRNLTVIGEGEVIVPPDEASFEVSVRTSKKDTKEALALNSELMDKVLKAIQKEGVNKEEIKTGRVAIYPEYQHIEGKEKLIGYIVENSIIVVTKNLKKIPDVYSAATQAGATNIYGLNFRLSNESEALSEALKKATEDAKKKADTLAKSMNVELGKVSSIIESKTLSEPYYPQFELQGLLKSPARGLAPPIIPGNINVKSTVKVTYELK